ncbi:hypothetical protein ACNKHQ_16730 [Shigella flexneri]
MRTVDGKIIVIPNGKICSGAILSTSPVSLRAVMSSLLASLTMRILIRLSEYLTRILKRTTAFSKTRPIYTVRLNELAPSSVNFVVHTWSLSGDLQNVSGTCWSRIEREFDANGISFLTRS